MTRKGKRNRQIKRLFSSSRFTTGSSTRWVVYITALILFRSVRLCAASESPEAQLDWVQYPLRTQTMNPNLRVTANNIQGRARKGARRKIIERQLVS